MKDITYTTIIPAGYECCMICLQENKESNHKIKQTYVAPCSVEEKAHAFCKECFEKYLSTQPKKVHCPFCKELLFEQKVDPSALQFEQEVDPSALQFLRFAMTLAIMFPNTEDSEISDSDNETSTIEQQVV